MKQTFKRAAGAAALTLGMAALASCGPTKVVSAPTPPVVALLPPQPVAVPMRPMPPRAAAIGMLLPTIGPDGVRNTVNARLNPTETMWNLRSGWNVAALNCLDARYQPILDGYKAMLKSNAKRLTKANADLDKQFRAKYGSGTPAIRARETYLTSVYNYFALPPARDYFCEAALQMSNESLISPPKDFDGFALVQLPRLEGAFEHFFLDMERWRIDVAQWDAKYGAPVPGYGAAPAGGTVYTNATYGPQPAAPAAAPPVQGPPPGGS